ncbi:hypothetical protein [Saccharibacillus alkalitolerans]|uniref:Uncharacterized protein n=1 Tax=Saccharibacillus alkalitolerans TaxID=2705290 RepID=A0ABX0F5J2_9BACL|nr:hypothetical protein [Saccharibacillus alkalitolerans]NGZ76221.1 hypothetical protein [Saccharibacillus alkalitolerans]
MRDKNSFAGLFAILKRLPMALSGIVHAKLHNGISLSKFEPSTLKFANGIRLSKFKHEQRNAAPVSRLRIGSALFARPLHHPQP